ncbi:MAG: TIGR00730 family Rossman fold protein [Candidatus Eremiobacteraeota bacterium]|nr:TIGR00730 family Rossman fold protein [Candidatus Eremiobacteraeota bacterium]
MRPSASKRVCVFCGSRSGEGRAYAQIAADAARYIAACGFGIVYGGGRVGLMGFVADAALAHGAEVIGVIPRALAEREVAHDGLTKLHVVETMHERKALMADLSTAFVALPGGYGTLDEFCEIVTWAQLGIHDSPIGILNAEGYFDELLAMFDKGVREGFISPANRAIVRSSSKIEDLLVQMGLV